MLVTVTEKGSFSAASRALQVPLATLIRRISDLEASLNARLLIRTTRRITLTDAGAAYVTAARHILELVDDAEREALGEFTAPKGELVITAPIFFGRLYVLPIVSEFLASFPDINVRLLLADRNLHLVDDHVDMAVRIGTLTDSAMMATRIGTMRVVTGASPALLVRHGTPAAPWDLLRMPCITFEMPTAGSGWTFRDPESGALLDVPVQPRLSVTTAEAAADAAVRGVGVVRLLHYQVAGAVERAELGILLEGFERVPLPVHLVHVARGQMPLKMRRFLDFAAPRLRQALARLGTAPSPASADAESAPDQD